MATPAPPMPPEVAEQASPQGAQSVFMAQGIGQPQPEMAAIQQALQSIAKLEGNIDDIVGQIRQIHPPLMAYLQPVAQGLLSLRQALQNQAKRSGAAQGSPEMPPTPQGNPASGPPMPGGMAGIEQ